MMYFEIRKKNGEIVASNISACPHLSLFQEDRNRSFKHRMLRSGYREFELVSVWLIVEKEKDLIKSSKLFNKLLSSLANMSGILLDYYLSKIRIHSHTLRSIQGKMKQKIDGLATREDFQGKNYSESKGKIVKRISGNVEKAADTICQLNKRVAEIDAHIEGFDVLIYGKQKRCGL